MLAVVLALCAAVSNALASVLQRSSAREAPPDEHFRLALILDLVRRRAWLAGIGALIGGFVFQAGALGAGELTLVQPLLALELPLTLLIAGRVFHVPLERRTWWGVLSVAGGLVLVLVGLFPRPGAADVAGRAWVIALVVAAAVIAALVVAGRAPGSAGAALLGAAAGVGFGVTAALMNGAIKALSSGLAAVFTSWQLYAMVAAGLLSLFILQNALHSGTLVAAQPAVTLADPVASVALGVLLFHDQVRLGAWLAVELAGAAAIVLGSIELSRSPVLSHQPGSMDQSAEPARPEAGWRPGRPNA